MVNKIESPWLSAANVATFLNLSEEMIYKLLWQGDLPAIRIRSAWRVHREVLDQWLAVQHLHARKARLPKKYTVVLKDFKKKLHKFYGSRLEEIYLFGSAARGTADAESDLDVLVVLKAFDDRRTEQKRVRAMAYEASFGQNRPVVLSTLVASGQELLKAQSPLMVRIREEGKIAT